MKCKIAGETYGVQDIMRSNDGTLWVKTFRKITDPFLNQFTLTPIDENLSYYTLLSNVEEFIYDTVEILKEKDDKKPIKEDPLNRFCRRGVLNTSATPKAPIDWEQRRYEIAKAAMIGRLTSPVIEGLDPNPNMPDVCKWSVKFADTLIDELKKQNNG